MTAHWYVLHSKPNKETFLQEQLGAHNIEVFNPHLRANPVNPRARKFKPYFPGYLFIHVDLETISALSINWIPGGAGFVCYGSQPAAVPDELIRIIKKQADRINAAGGEILGGLKKGDAVIIKSGAFAGFEAVFDERISGGERVRVLLKLIEGHAAKMELSAGMLKKIGA